MTEKNNLECPVCDESFEDKERHTEHKLLQHPAKFCSSCGEQLDHLPQECNYCKQTYCKDHRLPENHDCERLETSRDKNKSIRESKVSSAKTKNSEPSERESDKDIEEKGFLKKAKTKVKIAIFNAKSFLKRKYRSFSFAKFLPILGIIGIVFLSSFREGNPIFKDGNLRGELLSSQLSTAINEVQNALMLSNHIKLTITVILCITVWSVYRYWLLDSKYFRKSKKGLEQLTFVLIFIVFVARHVKVDTTIGLYVDWAMFLSVVFLELKGTWVAATAIDGIDMRSDLYLWLLRILGTLTMVVGAGLFVTSGMALSLTNADLVFNNIYPIGGACLFFLGAFMDYRSFRREPTLHVY